MTILEQLQQMKPGQIVNKAGLNWFKRNGFIWDYSHLGYLEGCRISCRKESEDIFTPEFDLLTSSRGNCKLAEQYNTMVNNYRQLQGECNKTVSELSGLFGSQVVSVEGMRFAPRYFDGCFKPYLVKL